VFTRQIFVSGSLSILYELYIILPYTYFSYSLLVEWLLLTFATEVKVLVVSSVFVFAKYI